MTSGNLLCVSVCLQFHCKLEAKESVQNWSLKIQKTGWVFQGLQNSDKLHADAASVQNLESLA